ncbi:MFS transporter [Actinokineospora spheciospongiae]|uniref:MFS transporter n=1 Tax=Actinokineospora spheciospongiae TaxID=909613 RepID=UPI000D7126ED|nr:MFS transporter [Actinokineospora spheciospongiae]PWW63539.1 putative MFS family arabinose efflux permease [Actinokineospora spheciospongiae]
MSADPPTLPRAARAATWGFFGLNGFVLGAWVVHIPVVEHDTGISHSTLGALLLVFGGAAFAGMQVTGPLADRFGHRVVVPAAAALLCVAVLGPGLAGGPWALGAALVAFGLGNGALDVAMNAHAVEVERAYGRPVMSAFHAVFSIGGAAAAGLGALVLGRVPTELTLGCVGAAGLLTAAVSARFLLPGRPAAEAAADTGGTTTRAPRRLVWLLGGLAFALMLSEGVAYDWAAVHLRDVVDTPPGVAALAYGAFSVAMTVGRFTADAVAARFGAVRVVRYGAALAAVGLAGAALSPWVVPAIAGWAVFGVGLSGCVPQLFTAAGNLDPRSSGALLARVVGLGYLGLLAGPAVIGGLTHWVALNTAFALPVALCVVGAVGARVLRPAAGAPGAPGTTTAGTARP